MKKDTQSKGISINIIINLLFGTSILLAICVIIVLIGLYDANKSIVEYTKEYNECDAAVDELRNASEFLTSESRLYIETGNLAYMDDYGNELTSTRRREDAIAVLESHDIEVSDEDFYLRAKEYSDQMEKLELHAMKLAELSYGQDANSLVVGSVKTYQLTLHELEMSKESQIAAARTLLYSKQYTTLQDAFSTNIQQFHSDILEQLDERTANATAIHNKYILLLIIFVCFFFMVVFFTFIALREALLRPLIIYMNCIEDGLKLPPRGAREMQKLADVFNEMYESLEE